MVAITAVADDADDVLTGWVTDETSIGILNEISTRGIFPLADPKDDNTTMQEVVDTTPWTIEQGNYSSVKEHEDRVEVEQKKEIQKEFAKWSSSQKVLEHEFGRLMISRLAAQVIQKDELPKTRLIHDLRRSKINVMSKIP